MKWSAHLEYKKYLVANAFTLPPVFYLYIVILLAVLGPWGANVAVWIAYIAVIVVFTSLFYCLVMYLTLRWMRRVAGTSVTDYEITDDALRLRVGRDLVSLPLDQLGIRREGKYYIKLKRQRTRLGAALLFFDDAETLQRAKALLNK